ncbi:nuclear factor interleukin-3-regulated protein-like [Mytilus trossulus]|uniref:nuclear factor interleukin-3-regulated protein-like n=1 Tax=Mytilus trossulus TaxID=6551 RepID=UPI003005D70B
MDLIVPSYEQGHSYLKFNPSSESNMIESDVNLQHRACREFVPVEKKDDKYWFKRVRNNASARKSRIKRKTMDQVIEKQLLALQKENIQLRNELAAINIMYRHAINSERLQTNRNGIITNDYKKEDGNKSDNEGKVETTRFQNVKCGVAESADNCRLITDDGQHLEVDDKSDNDGQYEQRDVHREEESSNFSGKSEMDDGRNYTVSSDDNVSPTFPSFQGIFPPIYDSQTISESFRPSAARYQSAYLRTPAMVTLKSEVSYLPYMIVPNTDDASENTSGEHSEKDNYDKVQRVPHKIRIKERLHSAFKIKK